MTYKYLHEGSEFCYVNVYHGQWSKVNSIAYLQVLGVNKKYSIIMYSTVTLRDTWN